MLWLVWIKGPKLWEVFLLKTTSWLKTWFIKTFKIFFGHNYVSSDNLVIWLMALYGHMAYVHMLYD